MTLSSLKETAYGSQSPVSILTGLVRRVSEAATGAATGGDRIQENTMRFMIIGKATKESESGVPPKPEAIAAMQKYHEELVKAGILLAAEGLTASSKGARVKFSGDKRIVKRWSVCRDERADCRLLDHSGEVAGRSDRVGETRAELLLRRRVGGRDPQADGHRGFR